MIVMHGGCDLKKKENSVGEIFLRTQSSPIVQRNRTMSDRSRTGFLSKNKYNQVFSLTSFSVQEMAVECRRDR